MYTLFQSCMKRKDLVDARRMHCLIIDDGHEGVALWTDHLIRLFAECNSLNEANRVFCKAAEPTIFTWNSIISAHEKLCEPKMALELYKKMQSNGLLPDVVTYLSILKACGGLGELDQGRLIHDEIVLTGLEVDVNIGSTLIVMYAKCGGLEDGRYLFDTLSSRNVVTWGAMIAGYVQNCKGFCALQLFESMQEEGVKPSVFTLSCALKACTSVKAIHEGRLLHHEIMKLRHEADLVIGSTLISMYSDSGCLEDARRVFNCLPDHDVVTWAIMISGYVAHGNTIQALDLFEAMLGSKVKPNMVLYLSILQACGIIQSVEKGRFVHHEIIKKGMDSLMHIKNALIDMYAKCEFLDEAFQLFECLPHRDIVSWGALIAGLVENGLSFGALELFNKMVQQGITPNKAIFLSSLKACSDSSFFLQGKQIHKQIAIYGMDLERVVGNAVLDMYVHFGCLEEARKAFDGIHEVDELSWGVMLAGYVNNGQEFQAIELFEKMQEYGLKPNKVIYLLMLKACSRACAIRQGRHLHMHVIGNELQTDVVIGSAAVDMYSKCGNLKDARKVFDGFPSKDSVLCGSMIEGYAQHGHGLLALELFVDMIGTSMELSKAIILSVVKASSSIKAIGWGFSLHHYCCESSLNSDLEIGSIILDFYAKCSYLEEAHKFFSELKDLDLVSWSAIISGCIEGGQDYAAIERYERMREKGIQPDDTVLLSILKACMRVGAIEHGRMIHDELVRIGVDSDDIVKSRLYDMYGGCGMVEEACEVLESLRSPRVILYDGSSAQLGQRDHQQYASTCFREMLEGLKPMDSTFSAILAVCSHAGMLREACSYFNAMVQDYGATPNTQHYSCMVDLLGRAGCLVEAEHLVETAPILPGSVMRISLLTNSKTHTALQLGKRSFQHDTQQNDVHDADCISISTSEVWDSEIASLERSQKPPQRTFVVHNHTMNVSFGKIASKCQTRIVYDDITQHSIRTNEVRVVSRPMVSAMISNQGGSAKSFSSCIEIGSACDISSDTLLYERYLGACGSSLRIDLLQIFQEMFFFLKVLFCVNFLLKIL